MEPSAAAVAAAAATLTTGGTNGRARNSFLERTFDILQEKKNHNVISWNADGTSIIVHDNSRFSAEVLPNYFKHNNYPSFVRQLNLYGFKKIISSREYSVHEFKHPQFTRATRHLLPFIKRNTNPQAAEKRRNAETLLKAIAKLKEKHEVYEKRVSELENKNTHLSDENKLLWSHMDQSRKRQKALTTNMSKVMMFLYQAFGSRAGGGTPAIQAGTADAVAALGEVPLQDIVAQVQVRGGEGPAGVNINPDLSRLPSDVSNVELPPGTENEQDDGELTPHPVLNRHNSLELLSGLNEADEGNEVDEEANPHWFGDDDGDNDEDSTSRNALHKLVRSVSSDTTGKYPDEVKNEYTELAHRLHQHSSDQDTTLKRIHTMTNKISESETPPWGSDDDDTAAPPEPKRQRVEEEESTDNYNTNGEAKKAAVAAVAASAAASTADNDLDRH